MEKISGLFDFLSIHPTIKFAFSLAVLLLAVFSVKYIARLAQWGFEKVIKQKSYIVKGWMNLLTKHKVAGNIFFAVGMVFLTPLSRLFMPSDYQVAADITARVMQCLVIVSVMLVLDSILRVIGDKFSRSTRIPVKGLTQAVEILFWAVSSLLIIATLINKDPALILGGLTALSAIVMLVFKDSIVGLVAGIQLSFNDLVRVGDWIEIPGQGADGDVIDIMLTTVLVQNWDNTIVSVPAYDLISRAFKNWRGMSESGGRRIKRAINIDLTTVRFLEEEDIKKLKKINLISDYLEKKQEDIRTDNAKLGDKADAYNARRLSNIGTFRRYCYEYLKKNPNISDKFTCMVRQLAPTSEGIPLEIYAFSSNTAWVAYEDIQSDIFDHFLSIISVFGLKVYQRYGDHPAK